MALVDLEASGFSRGCGLHRLATRANANKYLALPQLQALRDVYLVYKSIEQEYYLGADDLDHPERLASQSVLYRLAGYLRQYKQLFRVRRLRNALISSATVNLAQQLCGSELLLCHAQRCPTL